MSNTLSDVAWGEGGVCVWGYSSPGLSNELWHPDLAFI